MQALGWGLPVERLAWLAIELVGDHAEVFGSVDGQVRAFWKVLPE